MSYYDEETPSDEVIVTRDMVYEVFYSKNANAMGVYE